MERDVDTSRPGKRPDPEAIPNIPRIQKAVPSTLSLLPKVSFSLKNPILMEPNALCSLFPTLLLIRLCHFS
jgi:hypothetical protein